MKLPLGADAGEFIELRFKPEAMEANALPAGEYRMRRADLERLLVKRGGYQIADLIYGLMDWLDITDDPAPVLCTLRLLLDRHYPADGRTSARCRLLDEDGVERVFHLGAINCTAELITWQRREWLIAMAQPSQEAGQISVGAPGPISLKVARRIFDLSILRDMGEPYDSFGAAKRSSRSTASYYAWEAGSLTTVAWERGPRGDERGAAPEESDCLRLAVQASGFPPNQLAALIAIAAEYPD